MRTKTISSNREITGQELSNIKGAMPIFHPEVYITMYTEENNDTSFIFRLRDGYDEEEGIWLYACYHFMDLVEDGTYKKFTEEERIIELWR